MRGIKFRVWNTSIYPDLLESTVISLDNTGWIDINKETNGGIDLFTGLKDKNGKEIYETDIVKAESINDYVEDSENFKFKGEVTWCEDCAGFHLMGMYHDFLKRFVNLEVIGNRHQNPELLKD